MILVGTSGFSYDDWVGPFYPEGITRPSMLGYYASQFPVVELDFTYYTMPGARSIAGLERKTPEGFRFCVKAHKTMTHQVPEDPDAVKGEFDKFREAMAPLVGAGKLGCVLLQFPWGFKPSPESRDYVRRLPELLEGLPGVVEFRNSTWVSQDTFDLLKESGLGFCCVDEPRLKGLFPPLSVATSNLAYIRFHGRNADKWWNHSEAWERYDYLYSEQELREWVPKILRLADRCDTVYVLFNNCHRGQAATNAKQMETLLGLIQAG